MSGSTIGGIAGGVIGFYIGGPQGAQIGFAVGSMVGGALDPQHLQGPRLGDIPIQTSQEGVPRPIIYGSPQPFPGNIIMTGPKVFSTREEQQGKGGPVIETEEVHQTYAIRICEGPAICIQIWRDGKLVYDRSGTAVFDADSAVFSSKVVLYEGDETQLPDPTLEGLPAANGGGAGNVPAHRGTAYMVIEHDNLTGTGGRIPNYEFRMASTATIAPGESATAWVITDGTGMSVTGDPTDWLVPLETPIATGDHLLYGNGVLLKYSTSSGRFSTDQAETWSSSIADISGAFGAYISDRFWLVDPSNIKYSITGRDWNIIPLTIFGALAAIGGNPGMLIVGDNAGRVRVSLDNGQNFGAVINVFNGAYVTAISSNSSPIVIGSSDGRFAYTNDGVTFTPATTPYTPPGNNDGGVARIVFGDGMFVAVSTNLDGGKSAYSAGGDSWAFATGTDGHGGHDVAFHDGVYVSVGANWTTMTSTNGIAWTNRDNNFDNRAAITSVQPLPCSGYELPDAPGYFVQQDGSICGDTIGTATPGTVFLSEIELDIADRVGLSASQFDVSEITTIVVEGFLIGKQMPAAEALRPLATAYLHDLPEYDLQIHARRRGDASVITLTDDDFVASDEDEEIRAQAIELPRKLNLYFSDPNANYAVVPVPAERTSINVQATGIAAVQLPLVFNRNVAQQKAEILLKVIYEESQGRLVRELPAFKHADLVASDPITYDSKRWRINKLEQLEGTIKIDAARDRISNYVSDATANTVLDPNDPVSNIRGPTVFVARNLPRLRTQDNQPGIYIGATGLVDGWPGTHVYLSVDGGVTENLVATITARSTMGNLLLAVDDNDTTMSIQLLDNRTLSDATAAQLAARQNGFSLTDQDAVSEVCQFATADEDSNGDWQIGSITRGQLGTTAAAHLGGDDFWLLDGAIQFLPLDSSLAGNTLIFRAVTIGTPRENNPTFSVVFLPQFTGPESFAFWTTNTGDNVETNDGSFIQVTLP